MNKDNKKYILYGIKQSVKFSFIAVAILTAVGLIIALIRSSSKLESIYMSYYYFGGFSLIFAIPLLNKRDEDPKITKTRHMSHFYGFFEEFQNPYANEEMMKSFEEFRGEGFWSGIDVVIFALFLFLYGFILESITIYIRG